MHFLVADGRQSGDDHVKAIEPGPAFDEMIAGGTDNDYRCQSEPDQSEIAQGFHLVVGP